MKKRIKATFTFILIAAFLGFIIYMKNLIGAATDEAEISTLQSYITIVTLVVAAILFIMEIIPLSVTAMFIPIVLTLTGVLTSEEAFKSLSNSTILIYGGMFIVGGAMFATGLAGAIGRKVIALSNGSEIKLTLGIIMITALLSSVLSNTGTVAVLLPVCIGIADAAGWQRGKLLMPLAIMASVGGMMTLVGTPPNITVNATLLQYGESQFGFFEYAKFGIPLTIVSTIYLLTIGRRLLKSENKALVNEVETAETFHSKKDQLIAGSILLAVVVAMATEIIPLHIAAIAGGLLCIITGILTEREAYRSIDWSTIFLFAGALSLSVALEKTGAGALIANTVINAMGGNVSPYLLITVLFILTAGLTQFMSYTASAALLAPIGLQIAYSLAINPHAVLMTIAVAASAAFATPVATPPNTMVYGPGGFKFMDFVKVGVPLLFITYLMALLLIPLIWPF